MCWPRPSLVSRPSSPLLRESSRMTSLTWRHTLRVESVPRQFVVRPRLKCAIVVSLYLLFEACLYSVLCALYSPCSLQSCTSISFSRPTQPDKDLQKCANFVVISPSWSRLHVCQNIFDDDRHPALQILSKLFYAKFLQHISR